MSWEPSVRTRHLTVIISLILVTASAMLCFNLARLLNVQTMAKHDNFRALESPIHTAAQQAIFNRPLDPPQTAIAFDPNVRALIKAGVSNPKGFAYVALISPDGVVIANSDPQNLAQTAGQPNSRVKPMKDFASSRWHRQLWNLWRNDNVYEIEKMLSFRNEPFARLVAGAPAAQFREDLWPTIKLSVVFASIIAGLCMLTAVISSNLVLWPLRGAMEIIEELEIESSKISEPRPVNVEMQSIAQRLRELGRRFAGNRTEIEAIRDQLQQVVGSLSERVLLLDRERRVIMASPEAEKMLSGGRFTLRGQRLSEALSHSHPITALTERAYQTSQSLQEVATFPVNGAGQQAVVASLQIFEDRGQPAGALLTLRDFETLQRLETQLDFATKLTALNRITAGVAHEVKNPLHAMVLHLELLSAKLDAGFDPKPHVDILMSEVNRLKRVVQTFLDFTRPVELKLRQIDANALTREVILLAADARAQGINLEESYSSGPLLIKADPDMLKQAILNIIINGCQVMPRGGRLAVETGRDEENHVTIAITDSGPGIPEEARDRIFNLYYTTKPTGSGIGLAQAFRAVQLHNGRIKVESEVGAGACFRIILPTA
ncbi:MAG: sensor histidine kinase [Blastocatellia bacterium]